jgi:hypothetical protein
MKVAVQSKRHERETSLVMTAPASGFCKGHYFAFQPSPLSIPYDWQKGTTTPCAEHLFTFAPWLLMLHPYSTNEIGNWKLSKNRQQAEGQATGAESGVQG